MKRFLVFAGSSYYPSGGWNDLQVSHATLEEARAAVEAICQRIVDPWAHVVDLAIWRTVAWWSRRGGWLTEDPGGEWPCEGI